MIPTIASQLLAGREKLKLGALHPTRDFNFATDTASGMMVLALCKGAEGKTVNIGSGEEWSIAQTVDLLCEIVGRKVEIVTDAARIRPEKSEVNRLLADVSLMRELTGWQSQVPFKQGLEETVCLDREKSSSFEWILREIIFSQEEKIMRIFTHRENGKARLGIAVDGKLYDLTAIYDGLKEFKAFTKPKAFPKLSRNGYDRLMEMGDEGLGLLHQIEGYIRWHKRTATRCFSAMRGAMKMR